MATLTEPTANGSQNASLFNQGGDWEARLAFIVAMMREMSLQTDPQEMVATYGARLRQMMPVGRSVSLSRRELERPKFRITRASIWDKKLNPWKEQAKLPMLEGGLFG